jgi:hypothetical protein
MRHRRCPEGVSAISTMGTFVGFAASIVAARLMCEEALGAAMLARVVAATRAILEACGFDPRALRQADLASMPPWISNLVTQETVSSIP